MKYQENEALTMWSEFCFRQHDVVCNQQYGELPYSYHLKSVWNIAKSHKATFTQQMIALGHDLIEDARMTYNDVYGRLLSIFKEIGFKLRSNGILFNNGMFDANELERIANGIYACTELRGKNRKERHGEEYIQMIIGDYDAAFVKLCDVKANTLQSLAQGTAPMCKNEMHIVKRYLDAAKDGDSESRLLVIYNHIKALTEF